MSKTWTRCSFHLNNINHGSYVSVFRVNDWEHLRVVISILHFFSSSSSSISLPPPLLLLPEEQLVLHWVAQFSEVCIFEMSAKKWPPQVVQHFWPLPSRNSSYKLCYFSIREMHGQMMDWNGSIWSINMMQLARLLKQVLLFWNILFFIH